MSLPEASVVRIAKSVTAEKTRIGDEAKKVLVAKTEDYITDVTRKAEAAALHRGAVTISADDVNFVTSN